MQPGNKADIDGPTVQSTTVKVNVNKDETVIQLLTKLRDEQARLSTHSHAPYDELMRKLNDGGSEDEDAGEEILRSTYLIDSLGAWQVNISACSEYRCRVRGMWGCCGTVRWLRRMCCRSIWVGMMLSMVGRSWGVVGRLN